MIKVNNLTKNFGEFRALEDFNMHVKKGTIYGLVGPNGAGKTTLINHLVGVYKKDSGEVRIAGEEVYENDDIKSKIAYMPDETYFYSRFSVKDMKNFYRRMYKSFNQERYDELSKIIKIDEKQKVNKLSKGMRKQAFFQMLLAIEPSFLILDEPFDGIDVIMRKKIRDILINDVVERDMTILVSSHNLRELEDLCDTIGMIRKGKMITERDLDDLKGEIQKVQVAFKNDVKDELAQKLNILKSEKKGSVDIYIVKGNQKQIEETINEYSPLIVDFIPLSLEEVFIYEMEGLEDGEK